MRRTWHFGRSPGWGAGCGLVAAAMLLAGCPQEQQIQLVLTGTDRLDPSTYTVAVHDWPDCPLPGAILRGGEERFGRLHRQTFRPGEAKPVGALPPRRLQFAAVARDRQCEPLAFGCTTTTVGESSRVEVALGRDFSWSPPACAGGRVCADGLCTERCEGEGACPDGYECGSDGTCHRGDGTCNCATQQICCEDRSGDPICANVASDPDHCGECGLRCSPGTFCVQGDCDAPDFKRVHIELVVRGKGDLNPDRWLVGIVWLDVVGLLRGDREQMPSEVGLSLLLGDSSIKTTPMGFSVPLASLRPPSSTLSCPGACREQGYPHIAFAHIIVVPDQNDNDALDVPIEYINWTRSDDDRFPPRFGVAEAGLIVSAAEFDSSDDELELLEDDTGVRFPRGVGEGYGLYAPDAEGGLVPVDPDDRSTLFACNHEPASRLQGDCFESLPRPYDAY